LLPTFVCLPWEFGGLLGVFEREHFDVDLDFPRRIADRFAGSFATWITPLHYNKGGWESDCSRQWRLPRISPEVVVRVRSLPAIAPTSPLPGGAMGVFQIA
jgi:hypothetical protein